MSDAAIILTAIGVTAIVFAYALLANKFEDEKCYYCVGKGRIELEKCIVCSGTGKR